MLKKTITYKDYNGEKRTEDYYFDLNETEVIELQITTEGGLENMINKIVASNDTAEIYQLFKKIVFAAYGVKSADGRHFTKNESVREEFQSSPAYNELIKSFMTNPQSAADFINAILPTEMLDEKGMAMVEEKRKEVESITEKEIGVE